MNPPLGYKYAIDADVIKKNFPFLKLNANFRFTSLRTNIITELSPYNYNCVAWAIGLNDNWICMESFFQEYFDLDPDKLDHTVSGYADCLTNYGFEICKNDSLEEGFEKVAIYGDEDNIFLHVSRQLINGSWTSKMGAWEDIEHIDLKAISGPFYGTPIVFMKRPINELKDF